MRDMTEAELFSWYIKGEWPCGHGSQYISGPSGGLARNIRCIHCALTINITDPEAAIQLTKFGQVLKEPKDYVPPAMTVLERFQQVQLDVHTQGKSPSVFRRLMLLLGVLRG